MNKGIRSEAVSDALTRRQLDVERAKTALNAYHDAVTTAVIAALIVGLGRLNTQKVGTITKAELRALVKGILDKYDIESVRYRQRITRWLERYSNEEANYTSTLMNDALDESVTVPPVWPFVAGGIIGATGLNPRDTIKGISTSQRNRIRKIVQQAYAQNWSVGQLITAFRGTTARMFKDGLVTKLRKGAEAVVDTVVQYGMSAARIKTLQSYMDWTLGYTWVSILDSRTSQQCRSLSGQVFKYGGGPIPPIHYRCRSHIEPIFRPTATLNRTAAGVVTAGETYYQWLKRQPEAFQNDVLGPTWGRLFRTGGLTADEFAAKAVNARYQPITLDELRRRSPGLFVRAGV